MERMGHKTSSAAAVVLSVSVMHAASCVAKGYTRECFQPPSDLIISRWTHLEGPGWHRAQYSRTHPRWKPATCQISSFSNRTTLLFLITRGPNFSSSVQNSFCSVVLIRVIPAAFPTPFLSCSCPSPLLCFTFIDPSFSACTVLLIVRLTLS